MPLPWECVFDEETRKRVRACWLLLTGRHMRLDCNPSGHATPQIPSPPRRLGFCCRLLVCPVRVGVVCGVFLVELG